MSRKIPEQMRRRAPKRPAEAPAAPQSAGAAANSGTQSPGAKARATTATTDRDTAALHGALDGDNAEFEYDPHGRNLAEFFVCNLMLVHAFPAGIKEQRALRTCTQLCGLALYSEKHNFVGYVENTCLSRNNDRKDKALCVIGRLRIFPRLHVDAFELGIAFFDASIEIDATIVSAGDIAVPALMILYIGKGEKTPHAVCQWPVGLNPSDPHLAELYDLCKAMQRDPAALIGVQMLVTTVFSAGFSASATPARLLGMVTDARMITRRNGTFVPVLIFTMFEPPPVNAVFFVAHYRDHTLVGGAVPEPSEEELASGWALTTAGRAKAKAEVKAAEKDAAKESTKATEKQAKKKRAAKVVYEMTGHNDSIGLPPMSEDAEEDTETPESLELLPLRTRLRLYAAPTVIC